MTTPLEIKVYDRSLEWFLLVEIELLRQCAKELEHHPGPWWRIDKRIWNRGRRAAYLEAAQILEEDLEIWRRGRDAETL